MFQQRQTSRPRDHTEVTTDYLFRHQHMLRTTTALLFIQSRRLTVPVAYQVSHCCMHACSVDLRTCQVSSFHTIVLGQSTYQASSVTPVLAAHGISSRPTLLCGRVQNTSNSCPPAVHLSFCTRLFSSIKTLFWLN